MHENLVAQFTTNSVDILKKKEIKFLRECCFSGVTLLSGTRMI